jgi:Right handed beta helix region
MRIQRFHLTALLTTWLQLIRQIFVGRGTKISMVFLTASCMACNTKSPLTPPSAPVDPTEPFANGRMALSVSDTAITRPASVKLRAKIPTGTVRVVFYRDGQQISETTSAPFEAQAVFTQVERGTHQFSFKAWNANGRTRSSTSVPLEVNIGGKVRFVSPSGSDGNDGLSESKPFLNIQSAVNLSGPGDTVLVMDGTYSQTEYPTGSVVGLQKSGTADAWIALMAYPGQKPKLKSINWQGIKVEASYILVQGFTIEGNRDAVTLEYARSEMNNTNNPTTGGTGISVEALWPDRVVKPHHVIIRGNTIYKCSGGGIGTGNADYVTIEDNVIWGNSYYSPYASSGISTYQNWNSDNSTGYKMIIRRNVVYDNMNLIPFYQSDPDPAKRIITDGNGIIVDDSRNTQNNSTLGAYNGRTLIENNIVFNNGARGIHAYLSDHVDIVNNTTRYNSFQEQGGDGEVTVFDSGDVRVFNNIIVARSDRNSLARYATLQQDSDSQIIKRNMVFGGLKFQADPTQNLVGIDPLITDPGNQNFRPVSDSPAIDAGDSSLSAKEDFDRTLRPLGQGVDLGAFEVR